MKLLVLAAIGLWLSDAVAQNDSSYEPVEAAGKFHEVMLENDRVRVLSVSIAPGETVPFHQHTMESIFITLQPSALVFRDLAGNVVKEVQKDQYASLPFTEFRQAAPAPRSVTNVGEEIMRAIRIELKDAK
ncbi:MAG: hypothetical protein AAF358_21370 [Pseudomonadota bacterium]